MKLSDRLYDERYLEKIFDKKSEPLSEEFKEKLELASKNANDKINFNNIIYNQSNFLSVETICGKKKKILKKN